MKIKLNKLENYFSHSTDITAAKERAICNVKFSIIVLPRKGAMIVYIPLCAIIHSPL